MESWKEKRLSELLTQKKRDIAIAPDMEYSLVTISNKGEVKLREKKKGGAISSNKGYITKTGDFIYSRLASHTGSFGIVPSELDNALITNEMPCFEIDKKQILPNVLIDMIRLPDFIWQLNKLTKGMGRVRIKESMMLSLSLILPDISEQNQLSRKISFVKINYSKLALEITHQQTLLKKLRQQILQEAIEGKLTADWRQKQKLSPCQGGVPQSGEGVERIQKEVKKLNNLPYLKTFRKTLRKNLTPAEAKFWTLLKNKQLDGRRFRRQYSVANYILDFFCPAEKLAIELDGEVHSSTKAVKYDRERDIFLAHTGIKVLRFENQFVFHDPDGLLARIKQEFNPSASARHLPLAGEEFESASELLKRIQTEKEQLIKDKKIRKQKPLPPISEEEKPFELPAGWVFSFLANCYINKDEFRVPITKSDRNTRKKIYNYYGASGVIDKIDYYTHEGRHLLIGEDGANLVARSTPIAFIADGRFWVNNHAHVIASINSISLDYLTIHINAIDLKPYISGGFQPKLSQANLNKIIIAFPPLPEQQAIVAKVEKLLALCDQLEAQVTQNQAHAEQLMQAVLKEAFTYMEPRKTLI